MLYNVVMKYSTTIFISVCGIALIADEHVCVPGGLDCRASPHIEQPSPDQSQKSSGRVEIVATATSSASAIIGRDILTYNVL